MPQNATLSDIIANVPELPFHKFRSADPFDHCVIDDFFTPDAAAALANEFPPFSSEVWHVYNNALEVKKTLNTWNSFPAFTYKVFTALNSPEFIGLLSKLTGTDELYADQGLNGGGWHIHAAGGRLNPHLDYSIHPKLGLQRKINLLVYLNPEWEDGWGGDLGLWRPKEKGHGPGELIKSISPRFNRAVLFDTTQPSWHGIVSDIRCPPGQHRKSVALYYLTNPVGAVDQRGKALFHPTADQEGNEDILKLIATRSGVATAGSVYQKK